MANQDRLLEVNDLQVDLVLLGDLECRLCRLFRGVPGPLQSPQGPRDLEDPVRH